MLGGVPLLLRVPVVVAAIKMRVSSEGNDKPRAPEEELPIDINYVKFTDWLLDRQKVKANWRDSLRNIHQKVFRGKLRID